MPTLDWIGKDKVVNHHLDVPYRVLERKYSYDENGQHDEDNGSENMIIHGDNLDALKALLPRFEGRVKCIYIDPPYNTGNEKWVYNDNVNDPRILKWLGQVVGAEGEDLSRHDKWLCMMYPRLKLLQRLLSDDGVIFISIDDNELYNLKIICDEIFGLNCFVSTISWQRTYSKRNDSKGIPAEIEHILTYSKQPQWIPKRLPRTEDMDASYQSPDGDPRPWSSVTINAPGAATHQGMVYAIQHPITGQYIYPPEGRCWSLGQSQMFAYMSEWADYELKPINDYEKRCSLCGKTEGVSESLPAIVLVNEEVARENALKRYMQGVEQERPWPVLYFTANGRGGIRRKQYLDQSAGRVATNLWPHSEVGHTGDAANELSAIFGTKSPFDTPKPSSLITRVLQIASDPDSVILDSFAGSGTTAHAVLNMNKVDSGHRRFILVEMMDYADSITAERVKRVIDGYGSGRQAVEGTGGSFSYYELGEPLMIGNVLNEDVGVEKIREYVFFTDTKSPLPEAHADEPYYMGTHVNSAYYFYYERDAVTTLNREFLHTVKTKADAYVIYADLCMLSEAELEKYRITFKKIPRDITRL